MGGRALSNLKQPVIGQGRTAQALLPLYSLLNGFGYALAQHLMASCHRTDIAAESRGVGDDVAQWAPLEDYLVSVYMKGAISV